MAERSMKILWMVLLIVAAYQDFRERQVSVMWMVCGAAAGMIGCCLMAGERYQGMLETGIDAERVGLLMNIVKIQIVRIGKAAGKIGDFVEQMEEFRQESQTEGFSLRNLIEGIVEKTGESAS